MYWFPMLSSEEMLSINISTVLSQLAQTSGVAQLLYYPSPFLVS